MHTLASLLIVLTSGCMLSFAIPLNATAPQTLSSDRTFALNLTGDGGEYGPRGDFTGRKRSQYASHLLSHERPPSDFRIAPLPKPGAQVLVRDRTLVALVWCIGTIAQFPWNLVMDAAFSCREKSPTVIAITNAKDVQVSAKECIWMLARLLYWFTDQGAQWSETNWIAYSDEKLLAFGAIKLQNERDQPRVQAIGSNDTLIPSATDLSAQSASMMNDTIASWSSSDSSNNVTSLVAGPTAGITLRFRYYGHQGRVTGPVAFYSLMVEILVELAEHPVTDALLDGSLYDSHANITIAWGPTGRRPGRAGAFSHGFLIETILQISDYMASKPYAEQFHEFRASIQSSKGDYVGRFAFYQGEEEPEALGSIENAGGDYDTTITVV